MKYFPSINFMNVDYEQEKNKWQIEGGYFPNIW